MAILISMHGIWVDCYEGKMSVPIYNLKKSLFNNCIIYKLIGLA
jgi:hypothetical protein